MLGRPHAHHAWPEMGGFPMRHAAEIEEERSWLLPATHLIMEESPDHAAKRIANKWAGVRGTPKFVMVQSHLRPSGGAMEIKAETGPHFESLGHLLHL